MAVYSRFGSVVKLVRPVTTRTEVAVIEDRDWDDHDEERLKLGMYAAGYLEDDPDNERLFDLALLRADDGIREINAEAKAIGCDVK